MSRRERRTFTKDFKQKVVDLYNAGKTRIDLIPECDLTGSTFDNLVKQTQTMGPLTEKDNLTSEPIELDKLRQQNVQLAMENDILSLLRFSVSLTDSYYFHSIQIETTSLIIKLLKGYQFNSFY